MKGCKLAFTRSGWAWGLLLVALLPAGCAALAVTAPRPEFTYPQREPQRAPAGVRAIEVGPIVNKIHRQAEVGTLGSGPQCQPAWKILWGSKLDEATRLESKVIAGELQKAGYRISSRSAPDAESPDAQPSLLLRPTIMNAAFSECSNAKGYTSWSSVTIEWEIYDPGTRSVLFTTTTGGTARSKPGQGRTYLESVAAAARNLLAEAGFFVAARSAGAPQLAETVYPPLSLAVLTVGPSEPARASQRLQHARSAVVRVVGSGGEGSGSIVSASGLALTAARIVAGASGSVEVVLADGRRVRATVLRARASDDVALIELPRDTYPAVPVGSLGDLAAGRTVFAIAPPPRAANDRSVTQGVIGALRIREGKTIIQSDVILQTDASGGPLLDEHGRMVGIAIGRVGTGSNVFLGIDDAWRALQIQARGVADAAGSK